MGPASKPVWLGQLELRVFFFFFFFFPPEALSVAVTRGACTSDAERTRWARLPGRCGPVSWSFGSFFFFFFLQKPSLVPVTGGTLHLRPRGHDGPGFQADVARSAGALDLFFFFFQKPSCPRHRWHCTSEAERTLWARLPIRCGPVSWSFGSFFFF